MKKLGKLLLIIMGLFSVLLAFGAYSQGAMVSGVIAAIQAVLFFVSLGIEHTGKRVICIIVGVLLIIPWSTFLPQTKEDASHYNSSKKEAVEEKSVKDNAQKRQETDIEKEPEATEITDQQGQNTEATVNTKLIKKETTETKEKEDGTEKEKQKTKNPPQEESQAIEVSENTKKVVDEYELFYDGYIAFFKDYDSNDPSSLVKSLSLQNSAEDMNERLEKLKEHNDLSPTDLQYIADVEQRVQEKMKQLDN